MFRRTLRYALASTRLPDHGNDISNANTTESVAFTEIASFKLLLTIMLILYRSISLSLLFLWIDCRKA